MLFSPSWTPWCQRFTCCTPWLWSEGYGRMWWARPTASSLPPGHSTSKPTMARLWFSRYARRKLLPCPAGVHWTFVSVLSSVYQTEPQIKFFTPFELEKDAEEDPQKSCKPPSFIAFFFHSRCDCSLADWLLHHINLMWEIFTVCSVFIINYNSEFFWIARPYLPDQIKMQIFVSRDGHTDLTLCMYSSPRTRPSFLH